DYIPISDVKPRIRQRNAVESGLQITRGIGGAIVHVVALNTLIHGGKSTADDCLAAASQVIGKTKAWPPIVPVVIYETFRNPVLATDPDSILVELNAGKDRIGTRAKPWTRAEGAGGDGVYATDMAI